MPNGLMNGTMRTLRGVGWIGAACRFIAGVRQQRIRRELAVVLAASVCVGVCGAFAPARAEKLRVITTTEDLAAIARDVGGDLIDVEALARGYQDPHFVDGKPSFLVKLSKADLFVEVGRELDATLRPGAAIASTTP